MARDFLSIIYISELMNEILKTPPINLVKQVRKELIFTYICSTPN